MKIGFDAKRAFFNRSGLGNYSRNVIQLLSRHYPQNDYFLYTPTKKGAIKFLEAGNIHISTPKRALDKLFKSYWRSFRLTGQLEDDKIELYHGLSNELPKNIHKTRMKSVVTIHDLIFIRYPHLYKSIDRQIYYKKFKYSSQIADRVIAISKQTKADLVNFFKIDKDKIDVVYPGCHPIYYNEVSESVKKQIKEKYNLPSQYILYVGTIEGRKRLLNIIKALKGMKIDIPLVVVGKPTQYLKKVNKYISENQLEDRIYFYHNILLEDLQVIYQLSEVFVYPSVFEGFGIPILEALSSKTPVITTKDGCFSEAGGKSSIYIDTANIDELAEAIKNVLTNSLLRKKMLADGYEYAQNFREEKIVKNLMDVYLKL